MSAGGNGMSRRLFAWVAQASRCSRMLDNQSMTTKRTRGCLRVDVVRLPGGGLLFRPTIPDWELHQCELERRAALRRQQPQPESAGNGQ